MFGKRQWNDLVSQRFRHICHRFRGTFRLAIQMTSTNFLLPALPHSLACVGFFTLLLFSLFLYILIYLERSNEDPDLLKAIKSSRRIIWFLGPVGVLILLLFVLFAGLWIFLIAEELSTYFSF